MSSIYGVRMSGGVKWSECVTPVIRMTGYFTPGLLYDTMGYQVYLPCHLFAKQTSVTKMDFKVC